MLRFTSSFLLNALLFVGLPLSLFSQVSGTEELESYRATYPDAPGVYLEYMILKEMKVSGRSATMTTWEGNDWYRRTILVLDPESDSVSTFRFVMYHGELKNVSLKVTAPDGSETLYGLDDLEMVSVEDDGTLFQFHYPNVVAGSRIEEVYQRDWTLEIDDDLNIGDFIATRFYLPCRSLVVQYLYPETMEAMWRSSVDPALISWSEHEASVEVQNGKGGVLYDAQDIPSYNDDPPFLYERGLSIYDPLEANDPGDDMQSEE